MKLTPIFRIEKFLDAIINNTTPPEPVFRVEYFLAKIAGADVVTPEPMFRIEKYLAKILGEDVEIPEPMFRTEFWLAKKCGEDVETPDPAFRVEYWLEEWCGGSAPTYETITGKIVSFLTQRIAPLKIEASLAPIQDLHGYDNPWPPGGGKNKARTSLAEIKELHKYGTWNGNKYTFRGIEWTVDTDSAGNVTCITANGTASQETSFRTGDYASFNGSYILSGCPSGGNGSSTFNVRAIAQGGSVISSDYGSSKEFTVSEDTNITARITIYGGYVANNLKFYPMIRLSSVSDDTFAPYSNECPISGHTGAEVTRTGKNVLGGLAFAQRIQEVNPAAVIDTDAKTVSFIASEINNKVIFDKFKPNTQYTFILSSSSSYSNLKMTYTDGTRLGLATNGVTVSNSSKSLSQLAGEWQSGTTVLNYEGCGIFEGVLTADDFEAYQGTTVTVNFGSTVYGGTLTVNEDGTGQVDATLKYRRYTGEASEGWTYSSWSKILTYVFYSSDYLADGKKPDNYNCIKYCNQAMPTDYVSLRDNDETQIAITGGVTPYPSIRVPKTAVSSGTSAAFNAYLASNPLEIVYELATPVTFPLTPGQVEALQGQNVVWVNDSGEIKVTYRSN